MLKLLRVYAVTNDRVYLSFPKLKINKKGVGYKESIERSPFCAKQLILQQKRNKQKK